MNKITLFYVTKSLALGSSLKNAYKENQILEVHFVEEKKKQPKKSFKASQSLNLCICIAN